MPYRLFKKLPSNRVSAAAGCASGIGSLYLLTNIKKNDKEKFCFFEPKKLQVDYDYLAPDGSEIRRLQTNEHSKNGDMAHCKLPSKRTSIAIKHVTVEELWYITRGIGEMWIKKADGDEHLIIIEQDMALTIPKNTAFQFRNTSAVTSLEIIIITMPPWPGPDEAVRVQGKWEPSISCSNESYAAKK